MLHFFQKPELSAGVSSFAPVSMREQLGQSAVLKYRIGSVGHSSNCSTASLISNQSALEPVKICAIGRAPPVFSSVPSRTRLIVG